MFSVFDVPEDSRIVLPPFRRGISILSSASPQCDVNRKSYCVEYFRNPLVSAGVLRGVTRRGSFETNQVRLATLEATEAKLKLLAVGQLKVKDGRCYAIDPNDTEVRLKIHWVPPHVPDDTLR